jgi:CubicO group peptidase (beta-lactamase class C family)
MKNTGRYPGCLRPPGSVRLASNGADMAKRNTLEDRHILRVLESKRAGDGREAPLNSSRIRFVCITVVLTLGISIVALAQPPGKIDISKMNPAGLLVDRYSYMVQPYNFYYFHHMDELGFRTDVVKRGDRVYPLKEPKASFSVTYKFGGKQYSFDDYLRREDVTGFLVLHDNQIVAERYLHGANHDSRFVSQSVAKSILSILIGAAVDEGKIHSVNDPIVRYLPYLSKSGYRDVTIKEALQMSTDVDYSEDYRNPKSGAALIGAALITGTPTFKDFAASIGPSSKKSGTAFQYQSVNSQVLGLLLERVTGERLNIWAENKLWKKIGAQRDAFFYESTKQPDTCAFACFNATLRDYGRVGLMMLNKGKLGGTRVISESWVHDSTTPDAPYLMPKPPGANDQPTTGYAYQWWVPYSTEGVFEAEGIFGQMIYVNPARHVVIVQTSAWPDAVVGRLDFESSVLMDKVARQVSP